VILTCLTIKIPLLLQAGVPHSFKSFRTTPIRTTPILTGLAELKLKL